ncbi:MAG TPA: inositol monophosphatase family protein [Acidimicrobiia bacterium]|nr:inositol monophosphatase family protein [Acidimicrobiia bacterium]
MDFDLKMALEAARAGAGVVRDGFLSRPEVRMKGVVDPVTVVDDAAEEAIFEVLDRMAPGEDRLGEESGGAGWDSDRVWIVDPLDGTVNFVHGMPHISVSVGLWEAGNPKVGVVIDVMRGEEFSAVAGQGAQLDGEVISVSEQETFGDSLVVTGFPYDRRDRASAYAQTLGAVLAEVRGIRRLGSAALDLAWVASGRFDGYWEYGLGPWDAAAGLLLVEEAGGRVTDHSGGSYRLDSATITASNGLIHDRLSEVVRAHLPDHLR